MYHVQYLLVYVNTLGLCTKSPAERGTVVSACGIQLYDLEQKQGSLQKFGYTPFVTVLKTAAVLR